MSGEYRGAADLAPVSLGATSGSLPITEQPSTLVYNVRLKQAGVSSYSTIKQVTVDAASGGGTPPSSLGASAAEVADCEWSIELAWVAGSGSSTYTVEQKLASGSWVVLNGSVSGTSYLYDTVFGEGVGRIRYFRVKQNDVTGYSNTANVYIPRCT